MSLSWSWAMGETNERDGNGPHPKQFTQSLSSSSVTLQPPEFGFSVLLKSREHRAQ